MHPSLDAYLCRAPGRAPGAEPPQKRARADGPAPDTRYTPLERQILALKAAHPHMLLAFEVGYKLKFYGDDAVTTSQLLGIVRPC